jgi:hypothetical protein
LIRAALAARAALLAFRPRLALPAVLLFLCVAVVFGFFLAVEEEEVGAGDDVSPELCALKGATASSKASPPASHRAGRNIEVSIVATCISSLYADFTQVGRKGISPVTAMRTKVVGAPVLAHAAIQSLVWPHAPASITLIFCAPVDNNLTHP